MLSCHCEHAQHIAGHIAAYSHAGPSLRRRGSSRTWLAHSIRSQRRHVFKSQPKWHSKVRAADPSDEQSGSHLDSTGQPDRRGVLAGAAVLLGAGGFLATRSGPSAPSFASLEKGAIDLDTALANGKPTIIEFYAAW